MQSAAEQAPTHQGAPAGGLTSHPGSLRPTEIPEGPDFVVEGVPVVDVPAMHGFDAEPDLLRGRTLEPLSVVRDRVGREVLERGRVRARLEAGQVGRVRLKAETAKRGQVVACQRRRRDGDPRVGHIGRVGLGLLNLLGEQRLVDGAVVHVAQRHPSAGQHAVQLDDPADEVGVGLLPERFFALAEELIEEGRDRVGERVRIEPGGTQRIPRQPAVQG